MKIGLRGPGETTADVLIHWAAIGSVSTVTTIAAVISYGHARSLVLRYGVTGLASYTLPLTIDGLVATCSLILVDCARHDRRGPWHAWALLAAGACAQIAANVSAGLSHGIVGAIIAGWPALVACGCFELLLRHRRHSPAAPGAIQPEERSPQQTRRAIQRSAARGRCTRIICPAAASPRSGPSSETCTSAPAAPPPSGPC